MYTIEANNVNDALYYGAEMLLEQGICESSRNGEVLVMDAPVATTYLRPEQRVLFSPFRDANPFFHLMECLWMMQGGNQLDFLTRLNKRMAEFSDDGSILWGAYGWRWQYFFGYDQIANIVNELTRNPHSRRCVLSMWDGRGDLRIATSGGKDVPCNTHAYFGIRGGKLNMTVCNRSNDVIWGAYGANAVHFSFLQEFMAAAIGVEVGTYTQFSNNYHVYLGNYNEAALRQLAEEGSAHNYYRPTPHSPLKQPVTNYPIISIDPGLWHQDLEIFMSDRWGIAEYRDPFFQRVALPMRLAWEERKEKKGDGLGHAATIQAEDWGLACYEWILRRERKKGVANAPA